MSLWSRLLRRLGVDNGAGLARPPLDTLVDDPRLTATGLGSTPRITPWSVARLAGIFQAFETSGSPEALAEARLARQCLCQFWLSAPVDQLEVLYRSPIGECYQVLLAGRLARETLVQQEQAWKDALAHRLTRAFERPETANVLLAAMPYFQPGKMRVADPLSQVPDWLQEDYARLFDPQMLQRLWQPAALLKPAGQAYGRAPSLGVNPDRHGGPAPRREPQPQLPQLSSRRGGEALELAQSADFQSRMNGLINLHVIDPEDQAVQQELEELRLLLGQIWLDAPAEQLEALYRSSFGRLYRDLLGSGFSATVLSPDDRQLRNALAPLVADMSQPRATNALMAALPFYPPGRIAFGGGEQHLPVWLVREISGIYGQQPQPDSSQAVSSQAVSGGSPST